MLCKGDILEAHIKGRRSEGVEYDFVAFCGDGTADLCAVLRLSEADLAFPRRGFKLDAALRGKDGSSALRPEVASWTTGEDIIEELRKRLTVLMMRGKSPPGINNRGRFNCKTLSDIF